MVIELVQFAFSTWREFDLTQNKWFEFIYFFQRQSKSSVMVNYMRIQILSATCHAYFITSKLHASINLNCFISIVLMCNTLNPNFCCKMKLHWVCCFWSQSSNVVDDNGDPHYDKISTHVNRLDEEVRHIAQKLVAACQNPQGNDKCERAFSIHKCWKTTDPTVSTQYSTISVCSVVRLTYFIQMRIYYFRKWVYIFSFYFEF